MRIQESTKRYARTCLPFDLAYTVTLTSEFLSLLEVLTQLWAVDNKYAKYPNSRNKLKVMYTVILEMWLKAWVNVMTTLGSLTAVLLNIIQIQMALILYVAVSVHCVLGIYDLGSWATIVFLKIWGKSNMTRKYDPNRKLRTTDGQTGRHPGWKSVLSLSPNFDEGYKKEEKLFKRKKEVKLSRFMFTSTSTEDIGR